MLLSTASSAFGTRSGHLLLCQKDRPSGPVALLRLHGRRSVRNDAFGTQSAVPPERSVALEHVTAERRVGRSTIAPAIAPGSDSESTNDTVSKDGLALRPPTSVTVNSKATILRLLDQGSTNYRPAKEMGPAVDSLIAMAGVADAPAYAANGLEEGTWEVFYAPHIVKMSSALFQTKFEPIRYIFRGDKIISNVKFSSPVFGSGWLSASGTFQTLGANKVQISFNDFWVDMGADALREVYCERPSAVTGNIFTWTKAFTDAAMIDRVIGTMGRAAFFPSLSTFPVLYVDQDIVVFKFDPLSTNIAARHVV